LKMFPMISWDSKYIAVASDSGIIVIERNSGNIQNISSNQNDSNPTWSPDSKFIVFQRGQGSERDIYYADLEGNEKQLTSGNAEDSHPFWSPVNKDEILFLRDHKNLFLLSVSKGSERKITNYIKANITLDYPSFSFDGSKVYYSLFNKIGDIFVLENF
jgi:Tol biopolymer transport system component